MKLEDNANREGTKPMVKAATEATKTAPPTTYTLAELAASLQVCPRTIRRMLDQDAIPGAFRLGGRLRFIADEIDRWIADGCPRRGR